jgi:2-dehydropantoate 2-reductase
MHYGVIGTGPVGATFAILLRASGQRVSLLDCDRQRVETLREKPLKLKGYYNAEAEFDDIYTSFQDFAAASPDVVLVSVKAYSLAGLLDQVKDSGLGGKPVVSCQNGIDTENEIAGALGAGNAFRMVLNFGVSFSDTHEIRINFLNEPHFFSCVSPGQESLSRQIIADLGEAGMGVEFIQDIRGEVFKKAILNTCLGSICALTRTTMSEAMSDADLERMIKEIIRESISICSAHDIDLGEDFLDKAITYLAKGGNHKPSMLVDIENARRTENHHLAGKLLEYAERKEISAPVIQSIFYLVKALESAVLPRESAHSLSG